MLKYVFKAIFVLGFIYSLPTWAAIPTPPGALCYQNCINLGYDHNYCVEHCKHPKPPPGRSLKSNDTHCKTLDRKDLEVSGFNEMIGN